MGKWNGLCVAFGIGSARLLLLTVELLRATAEDGAAHWLTMVSGLESITFEEMRVAPGMAFLLCIH